ncbi:MAG: helix-turn-helix domain-containing protein [Gammaproteobacteria bacterium]|nr:helix-turn-helix domain-containing protein [Gammaproteobacteria bacterium]
MAEEMPDAKPSTSQSPQTPGSVLALARKNLELSQKDVAEKIHLTAHFVNLIENDLYEELPGHVFARGYIKLYGELLGLDSKELLTSFDRFVDPEPEQALDVTRTIRGWYKYRGTVLIVLFVILLVGLTAILRSCTQPM